MSNDQQHTVLKRLELTFEEFDAAIAAIDGRTMRMGREQAPWLIDSLSLDGIELQVMQEGGANTYEGGASPGIVSLCVPLPAPSVVTAQGLVLDESRMIVVRPGDATVSHSRGVCRYAMLSIPIDRLIRSSDRFDPRLTERLISGPPAVDVKPAASRRAADLVARVLKAATNGAAIGDRSVRQSVAKDLIGEFIAAAASGRPTPKTTGRPRAPRRRIVRRVSDFLNSMQTGFRSVADMARFVEVPERTLREVVSEEFGLPPKRLLKLRQLYDIRSALLKAPLPATVTCVAADHGIWEFGRFAGQYRQTFGEYPSETLAARRSDR